ncbi:FixH family protein [Yunchengibacter salinarum]|uniref:FixH family protein n=1 Tax=Yunchengibacter salinarum TaxID=3133399 RepID=UPI0035B6097B
MTGTDPSQPPHGDRRLTGRHVLFGVIGFFAVVFGVNFIMAWLALDTFSGVSTSNAYERGRAYNDTLAEAKAQAALDWDMALETERGEGRALDLTFTIRQNGAVVPGRPVTARIRRPARKDMDHTIRLQETAPGTYRGTVSLPLDGRWSVRMITEAANGTPVRQDHDLFLEPKSGAEGPPS